MGVRLRNTGPVQWRVAGRRGFPAPRTLREQGPAMLGSTAGGGPLLHSRLYRAHCL